MLKLLVKEKIIKMLSDVDCQFNRKDKRSYQSLPTLEIPGERDTIERIQKYNFEKHCKDLDVVNVGSNIGFLDIEVAPICKSIISIENVPEVCAIEQTIVDELNIDNITVMNESMVDGFSLPRRRKCDVVFSAAAHRWIGIPFKNLINTYIKMLRKKDTSKIFIESHKFTPGKSTDQKGLIEYQELCDILSKSCTKLEEGDIQDERDKTGKRIRRFSWWKIN